MEESGEEEHCCQHAEDLREQEMAKHQAKKTAARRRVCPSPSFAALALASIDEILLGNGARRRVKTSKSKLSSTQTSAV